jgi:hypothetical protein
MTEPDNYTEHDDDCEGAGGYAACKCKERNLQKRIYMLEQSLRFCMVKAYNHKDDQSEDSYLAYSDIYISSRNALNRGLEQVDIFNEYTDIERICNDK